MLNIVIPMAGAGSRFVNAGYKTPKPLILVGNHPMIQVVINNLRPKSNHRFIFICQTSHNLAYNLNEKLKEWAPASIVIGIDGVTEGAACTVLAARSFINTQDPLMIANSDQWINADIDKYLDSMTSLQLDGYIMAMQANDPKWSFVQFDKTGLVERVVEKEVISDVATVGIYNFRAGSDFVAAAERMIKNNVRVNGEFYVAPVYNEMIAAGFKVGAYNIGPVGRGMYGLGTPEDLNAFIASPDFSCRNGN